MTPEPAGAPPFTASVLPTLTFYTAPGCGLCHEARTLLQQVLEERAAAGLPGCRVEERRIGDDPAWQRRYAESIPVLAIGERELPLAISGRALRDFLRAALDSNLA
jgi:hypothetical protein